MRTSRRQRISKRSNEANEENGNLVLDPLYGGAAGCARSAHEDGCEIPGNASGATVGPACVSGDLTPILQPGLRPGASGVPQSRSTNVKDFSVLFVSFVAPFENP